MTRPSDLDYGPDHDRTRRQLEDEQAGERMRRLDRRHDAAEDGPEIETEVTP